MSISEFVLRIAACPGATLFGYHTLDHAVSAYITLFHRIWSNQVWARDFGFFYLLIKLEA